MTTHHSHIGHIHYYEDVFSEVMLDSASAVLPVYRRKIRWNNVGRYPEVPEEITEIRKILTEAFNYGWINTSIIKRYSPGQDSEAYRMHRDPDEFMSYPLVLITLDGRARLTVEHEGVIKCRKGSLVILEDPHIRHMISPSEDGPRTLLFFGHSRNYL